MKLSHIITAALICSLWGTQNTVVAQNTDRGFKHPGGLHTQADFDRIKKQLADGNKTVVSAYNVLKNAAYSQSNVSTSPVEVIVRGGGSGENYMHAARGAAMAYQNALRWKIEGTEANARKAVNILMQWANTTKDISGDSNYALGAGLYGYEFAQAAELMRDYEGWKAEDFATFQRWLLDVWYPKVIGFMRGRNGTWENSGKWWQAPGHYWSNWGLCNALALLTIGVVCDDVFIYNQGMSYIKTDQCGTFKENRIENPILNDGLTEFFGNLVVTVSESELETGAYGKLGQMNESGRDIGHATMALGLAVDIAHMGWNQGDDLFSFMDHRLAAGIEYIAAQNQQIKNLPWTNYKYVSSGYAYTDSRAWEMTEPALGEQIRPYWGTVIGHYEGIKGVTMPFSEWCYKKMGIDGGGQGSTSGGYDHLGYSVLMNTYDGLNTNPPTELTGNISYGGKTYNLNLAGGLTNTYSVTAEAKRGIKPGTQITLTPIIADGSEDTGKWQWNTGETTREITITADRSYMYRATYTNARGVTSEQCFSIAVLGDSYESKVTPTITYKGTTYTDRNCLTIKKGTSVTLSVSNPEGFSTYKWTTLAGKSVATSNSKTLSSLKKDTTLVAAVINQGGRYCKKKFTILVSDSELEADKDRKADVGNYLIRHRYTNTYITNDGPVASLQPLNEETPLKQVWYLNRTENGNKYNIMSLSDSLSITINSGAMKKLSTKTHQMVFAKNTNYINFINTKSLYWSVNEDMSINFGNIAELYDFPFELIPYTDDVTAVNDIRTDATKNNKTSYIYDLNGRRVSHTAKKGIYIINGKKIVK